MFIRIELLAGQGTRPFCTFKTQIRDRVDSCCLRGIPLTIWMNKDSSTHSPAPRRHMQHTRCFVALQNYRPCRLHACCPAQGYSAMPPTSRPPGKAVAAKKRTKNFQKMAGLPTYHLNARPIEQTVTNKISSLSYNRSNSKWCDSFRGHIFRATQRLTNCSIPDTLVRARGDQGGLH